jgi:hypothetical protein
MVEVSSSSPRGRGDSVGGSCSFDSVVSRNTSGPTPTEWWKTCPVWVSDQTFVLNLYAR